MAHRPESDFSGEVCQPFLWEGEPRHGHMHGVLLLHGFTGCVAQMRLLAEALHADGFTVMGVNLPGHATSMDDMAGCSWQDWIDAAKEAFRRLQERCDFVSAAGLSMGGCLALIIGEQMQPTSVATISAPMGTKAPLWLTPVAAPFVNTVWWRTRVQADAGGDSRYDAGYPGFRTACGSQLRRLIKLARQDLHAVTCPVLIVQSRADESVAPSSAETILQGVSCQRRGILWLETAPHVCTLSGEAGRIAAAMAEHFRWAEEH